MIEYIPCQEFCYFLLCQTYICYWGGTQVLWGWVELQSYYCWHVFRFLRLLIWAACLNWWNFYIFVLYHKCISFCLMQAITLILLIVHTFFPLLFEGYHLYWKSPLNRVKVLLTRVILLRLFSDLIFYNYLETISLVR